MTQKRKYPGVVVRHRRGCASRAGGSCDCRPAFSAWAWSPLDGQKIWKQFPTLAAARGWPGDAQVAVRRRTLRAPAPTTVREAAETWLLGAEEGTVRARGGERFKPSTIASYRASLDLHVLPRLGARRLSDLDRLDLQDLADRLLADGLSPSSVRNSLMPLRSILRRAVHRGELAVNATAGLELPVSRGHRDRIASPEEAARLIEALPPEDRALWATAFYAGLRLGELQALRWEDIDLDQGRLSVERAWDGKAHVYVAPKSRAGRRVVPIPQVLRQHLLAHRLATGRRRGLVFGRDPDTPFAGSSVWRRARTTWKAAGETPIGLHEARHTFASLMIAAGVNPKALSTFMGHSSITLTLDRYGHLMPGSERDAAARLDNYLARCAGRVVDSFR